MELSTKGVVCENSTDVKELLIIFGVCYFGVKRLGSGIDFRESTQPCPMDPYSFINLPYLTAPLIHFPHSRQSQRRANGDTHTHFTG